MHTSESELITGPRTRTRRHSSIFREFIVWGVWLSMTLMAVGFVRQYTRNVPYWDDFAMVPIMTGQVPLSVEWAWSQHSEHRPVVSRLILAAGYRLFANDFRTGMYINVAVTSLAAASVMLLARRIRGYNSITDAVLPLAILNFAQAEVFLIGFALNLVVSSWIAIELIAAMHRAGEKNGYRPALRVGLLLVLLPLTGGSGLVLLPPLMLWLLGQVLCAWWSGAKPAFAEKLVGLVSLATCAGVVSLYLWDYRRPDYHPPAPSFGAAASTTLEFLSLAVVRSPEHWRPVAVLAVLLVVATLWNLGRVMWRTPHDRSRAAALIALLCSLLCYAVAIGMSRSGLGPGFGLTSRYVTSAVPLLAIIYIAWLVFGSWRTRMAVHTTLLIVACLALPPSLQYSRELGRSRRNLHLQTEHLLRTGTPATLLSGKLCPRLTPSPDGLYQGFRLLKDARIGEFSNFVDDRVTSVPVPDSVTR